MPFLMNSKHGKFGFLRDSSNNITVALVAGNLSQLSFELQKRHMLLRVANEATLEAARNGKEIGRIERVKMKMVFLESQAMSYY